MKTPTENATSAKPPRLAVDAATFVSLLAQGNASHVLLRPSAKSSAELKPGVRVVVTQIQPADAPRVKKLATIEACIVGRRDEANPDSLPAGSVPATHRGPVACLSLVTDEHADALRPSGMLYELLPHYVDRNGRRS